MPRTSQHHRALDTDTDDADDDALPELALISAMLRQVIHDAAHGVPVQSMQKVPISCACKINVLER